MMIRVSARDRDTKLSCISNILILGASVFVGFSRQETVNDGRIVFEHIDFETIGFAKNVQQIHYFIWGVTNCITTPSPIKILILSTFLTSIIPLIRLLDKRLTWNPRFTETLKSDNTRLHSFRPSLSSKPSFHNELLIYKDFIKPVKSYDNAIRDLT